MRITNLSVATKSEIREVVKHAMSVWPNAHLGDRTRREEMHSAFLNIRARVANGLSIWAAVIALDGDCYRYHDM